jgi:hypothetical protein
VSRWNLNGGGEGANALDRHANDPKAQATGSVLNLSTEIRCLLGKCLDNMRCSQCEHLARHCWSPAGDPLTEKCRWPRRQLIASSPPSGTAATDTLSFSNRQYAEKVPRAKAGLFSIVVFLPPANVYNMSVSTYTAVQDESKG